MKPARLVALVLSLAICLPSAPATAASPIMTVLAPHKKPKKPKPPSKPKTEPAVKGDGQAALAPPPKLAEK